MEKLVLYGLGAFVLFQVMSKPAPALPPPRPVTTSSPVIPAGSPATRDQTMDTVRTIAITVGSVAELINSIYSGAGSDPAAHADNSGSPVYV